MVVLAIFAMMPVKAAAANVSRMSVDGIIAALQLAQHQDRSHRTAKGSQSAQVRSSCSAILLFRLLLRAHGVGMGGLVVRGGGGAFFVSFLVAIFFQKTCPKPFCVRTVRGL